MLTAFRAPHRNCQGLTRRELLAVGAVPLLGLSLGASSSARRETSCILLWMDGGPSQLETFDPKPDAPDNVRGPYGAIRTSVPGVLVSELVPMIAERLHRCALVRSMTHRVDSHSPIPMMTAFPSSRTSHGAVVSRLKGPMRGMPAYVHLGGPLGVGGGVLGSAFDPVAVRDPTGAKLEMPQFGLRADVSAERFRDRSALLAAVDRTRARVNATGAMARMDHAQRRAAEMLTSPKVRDAFDLKKEKEAVRDRYGANFFGQSCLTARRLVEAGTRFVQVKWYDGPAFDAWDVHGADLGGLVRMEECLCPRFDQGFSALIDDLHARGLLETTLVIAFGEFGRTPRLNRFGARDHWPACQTVLMAGGGVPGGTVVGASDREGAYPAHTPVSPPDLAATVYRLLGIDTNTDPRVRPFIGTGAPVAALV
ncbi:MAG: DUF1501 domain-containing protein [Gemmataceae bacterium]|nr:DUF1501 domain-containing protein [Gemmataceae bacterium]